MTVTWTEDIASRFHEAYERLAPTYGYKTREASAVPWEQVPEQNKSLMIAVIGEILEPVWIGGVDYEIFTSDDKTVPSSDPLYRVKP
jgi:hypothetical protein